MCAQWKLAVVVLRAAGCASHRVRGIDVLRGFLLLLQRATARLADMRGVYSKPAPHLCVPWDTSTAPGHQVLPKLGAAEYFDEEGFKINKSPL
jgi:hypothetical protein